MYRQINSFILLLNILHIRNIFSMNNFPLWTWDCIDDICVPTKATQNENIQSLVTCNMLCSSLQLWPQPTGAVKLSRSAVPVSAKSFNLKILSYSSKTVRDQIINAFDLFLKDIGKLSNTSNASKVCHAVEIRFVINENGSKDPRMLIDTDESYVLKINPKNNSEVSLTADITTNSFCGGRHALETLLQMVWIDPYTGNFLMMETASIEDRPRFRYRGLMMDTTSNYFSLHEILRTIDAMAASKLNTFHWHALDTRKFSIRMKSLAQTNKYIINYRQSAMYSLDEVHTIVQHARLRGIRVLLEVNLFAPVWGLPIEIDKFEQCFTGELKKKCNKDLCKQIIIHNPNYYNILKQIYAEITQITDVDDIVLLGSHDFFKQCQNDFNSSNPIDLWTEFISKVLERLESINRILPDFTILWSTNFFDRIKIDLNKYIHKLGILNQDVAWEHNYISGMRTIISHKDVWDINSGYDAWNGESGGAPYNSWQRIYEHRPWAGLAFASNGVTCFEGGEATVWSSMITNGSLDAHVWPRAAALAERLWSDPLGGATRRVHARLDAHRLRLLDRGIKAAPLWSMWCTHNPFTC